MGRKGGDNEEMSRLTEHAAKELVRVGLFDADADYDGALACSVMELIMLFADQDHSGGSAETTIELFTKLARFEKL